MNRKTLIIAISIIIAACAGIYFWGEWQKAKFDASLPQVPVQEQETQVSEQETGGHWHGDEWHAEPHTGEQHAEPTPPLKGAEIMLGAEIIRGSGRGPEKPRRASLWSDIDLDYPPEGAPRPLKHLSDLELYNAAVLSSTPITDEERLQAQREVFFRVKTKEERDELRQRRARRRAKRVLHERIKQLHAEYFRAKGGTQ